MYFLSIRVLGIQKCKRPNLIQKRGLKGTNCSTEGCNIIELCLKYQSDRGLKLKDRES